MKNYAMRWKIIIVALLSLSFCRVVHKPMRRLKPTDQSLDRRLSTVKAIFLNLSALLYLEHQEAAKMRSSDYSWLFFFRNDQYEKSYLYYQSYYWDRLLFQQHKNSLFMQKINVQLNLIKNRTYYFSYRAQKYSYRFCKEIETCRKRGQRIN